MDRDRKKQRWIDKGHKQIQGDIRKIDRDKENGFERYNREFRSTNRQRKIEVDRQGTETNIGGYTKNRQR